MLPFLHVLVRVEEDGSLHALGAFTTKEKQLAYKEECGLEEKHVRLDFYNGPFPETIQVIYAGHRRWNQNLFQLGGYFNLESEAWAFTTQEGYVSVLKIDTTYAEEKALEKEALERYAKLQKRWRLVSYEELIEREGADKARANIQLRFYEDALESFRPKNRRDRRLLYLLVAVLPFLPLSMSFFLSSGPEYGENVRSVDWLPDYASDISFYRSKQVEVYEFQIEMNDFKSWAVSRGMKLNRIIGPETLGRYTAYAPDSKQQQPQPSSPEAPISLDQIEAWQNKISVKVDSGLIAVSETKGTAVYDASTKRAYYQRLVGF